MAPNTSKANYKSYEAQARMIRAIVAAHPDVKWNYKEIVACYGSDITEHALNHRFRRYRAETLIIREGRKIGLDPKDLPTEGLPTTQEAVGKNHIATYFGQSTGDGIQFQFRSIKKDADALRKTVAEGGDPLNCPISTDPKAANGTPSKTPRVRATPTKSAARGATSVKRARATPSKHISSEDDKADDDDDNENWSEKDMDTPTKRPKTTTTARRNATPGRQAASAANDTIANASSQLNRTSSFGSSSGADVNPPSFSSIFGQPEERKPDPRQLDAQAAQAAQAQAQPTQTTTVFRPGSRSYVGHSQVPPHNYMSSMTGQANMMDDDDDDDDIDGEI